MKKYLYFQPEYFIKFICDGVNCKSNCCKRGWQISIDKATYEKYSRFDFQEIIGHIKLYRQSDTYLLVLNEKNACPFLNEKNLCGIQLKYGENFLSTICRNYPRVIFNFGEFFEQSLNLSCPIAAEIILFEREPLRFELFQEENSSYKPNSLTIPEKFIAHLFEIQTAQISILQERTLSIDQRLIVLGFFLDKLEEISALGLDEDALRKVISAYESKKFLAEQVPHILASVSFDAKKFIRLMIKLFNGLYGGTNIEFINRASDAFAIKPDESNRVSVSKIAANYQSLANARRIFLEKYSTMLENYLVNELFMNCYPWRFTESISTNFVMFITTYKILEFLLFASTLKNFDSKDDLLNIVVWFSEQTDHVYGIRTKIYEQIKSAGDSFELMESLIQQ